ncbi:hypothetical protein LF1_59120 [Rubripirellula obstinata]|uniref:Uncharacterized protein n=1 Tax=Rubripirellula obstinata TaxID=406547 RepID=A0A5B1C957_9BACT|nr:hypothetical protein LF1_59120 [Rubripirellula obstinata]
MSKSKRFNPSKSNPSFFPESLRKRLSDDLQLQAWQTEPSRRTSERSGNLPSSSNARPKKFATITFVSISCT